MPDLNPAEPATASRRWTFGDCEYMEVSRQLFVAGRPIRLESKPLDVLQLLLERPTQVLTKDELIGAAWSTSTTDQSLATAISKLRKAFGGVRDAVILNVSGVGYRMAVPVTRITESSSTPPPLKLHPGDPIPHREDWTAVRPLSPGHASSVWLARHRLTQSERVFKFATDGVRLRALQREVALSRLFAKSLQNDHRFVPILDWNLEQQPFFIESEFGGENLLAFAATETFQRMPLDERVALAAEVTEAVAEAHGLGTLHNDLKPSNILLLPHDAAPEPMAEPHGNGTASPSPAGHWQVKVADFGVASLSDPGRLLDLEITSHGEFSGDGDGSANGTSHPFGTAMYRAPELLLPNAVPSMRGDVYALGIVLYQLVCGDLLKPPSPGWEARVPDPLLREDIAAAANIDPQQRLATAAELRERLTTLPARRAERDRREREGTARLRAEGAMARARERRPWVVLTILALLVSLLVSLWFDRRARRQEQTAARVNQFLREDLLQQSNPMAGNLANETLREAVDRAALDIDPTFPHDPGIAAGLHDTVARALNSLSDFTVAAREFDAAAARWTEAEGPLSQHALADQYEHIVMEARSLEPHSIDRARLLCADQDRLYAQVRRPSPLLQIARLSAAGTLAIAQANAPAALAAYKSAAQIAEREQTVPKPVRFTVEQRLTAMEIKAGMPKEAEQLARHLIAVQKTSNPHANVDLEQINLAQALLNQGKYQAAIDQANAIYPAIAASLGPENTLTLQVVATRSAAEGTLEQWDAAIRDQLTLAAAAKKRNPHGLFAIGGLADAALSECRAGHLPDGEAHAREAYGEGTEPGMDPAIAGDTAYTLASCLLIAGASRPPSAAKLAEADQLLRKTNAHAVEVLTGDPDWEANVDLARAQLAFFRHHYPAASLALDKARPALSSPASDPYQHHAVDQLDAQLSTQRNAQLSNAPATRAKNKSD